MYDFLSLIFASGSLAALLTKGIADCMYDFLSLLFASGSPAAAALAGWCVLVNYRHFEVAIFLCFVHVLAVASAICKIVPLCLVTLFSPFLLCFITAPGHV